MSEKLEVTRDFTTWHGTTSCGTIFQEMEGTKVTWGNKVSKQLDKVPYYIRDKFHYWVDLVEKFDVLETRKIKSFHDESLKGELKGKRSIRLSKSYRAIYREIENKLEIEFIEVLEVSKHGYKK